MKKQIIAMGILNLLALTACTDNNTAGNAIEPNGIAENTSSSSVESAESSSGSLFNAVIDFDQLYTFSTEATASSVIQDIVSVNTYEEENAASASCKAAEQELTGVTRIQDGLITRGFSGRNLRVDVEKTIYYLKKACAYTYDAAIASIDSLITTTNGFDFACVTTTDIMNIDEALGLFNHVMATQCKLLEKKVKQDTQDSANAANREPIIEFPEEDPDTISIDTSSRTLSAYATQFARPEDLSFDSHVLAYNSNLNTECINAISTPVKTETYIPINTKAINFIEKEDISACFPTTDSIGKFSKKETSCKYYVINNSDSNQPTAHVLTKVAQDTITAMSIGRGFSKKQSELFGCAVTNMISHAHVIYLIEDCEGIINENTVVKNRYAQSSRWICGTSNEYKVRAYGEWYSEALLDN